MVLIISDFAKIFGCLVGLPDEITAITIVTFGTSQIDLFASRIAAVNDPIADNSIGNVVAANAIGVFLGEKDLKKIINVFNYLLYFRPWRSLVSRGYILACGMVSGKFDLVKKK